MALRDVVVAEVLAHDVAVLALDEGVVVAVPGPRLGELDVQLVEQVGDVVADVLGAVVGMEPFDHEGKQVDQAFQQRHQEALRDGLRGPHELVLRDLVGHVDQIDALAAVAVALVDGVDASEAGQAVRPRRLAQGDADRGRLALLEDRPLGAVGARPAQVVDVAAGDARQALEADLAEALELAPQHLCGGGSRHLAGGVVDLRQQPDIASQVALREGPAAVGDAPITRLAGGQVLADQAFDLRQRHPRGLGQKAPKHVLVGPAAAPVAEASQRVLHERVRARPILRLVVHRRAALDERPHLLQGRHATDTEVHNHVSMIVWNLLHHHIALESASSFTIT